MKQSLSLLLLSSLILCSCKEEQSISDDTKLSPAQMYAKAEALIKPHVEGEASDFKGALEWVKRAAEAGYLKAQTDLGGLYLEGGRDGIERDLDQAYQWFQKAAAQGSAQADYFLGCILYQGAEHIPADIQAALKHWTQAADKGLPEAKQSLGHYYARSKDTITHAITLLEEAAQAKIAAAAVDLGYIYARGQAGLDIDMKKAAHWYQVAAGLGDKEALYIVALMEFDGEVLEHNSAHALSYLRLSAGQDYKAAIAYLVNFLRMNGNSEAERKEADAWEKRLQELKNKAKQ